MKTYHKISYLYQTKTLQKKKKPTNSLTYKYLN